MIRGFEIKRIAGYALLYAILAFVFSLTGFVAQPPAVHFHEYSFPQAALELGGHFAFGALAAIPLRSLSLSLVSGSFAIAIDVDHLLAALNLSVTGRPDHSIGFAVFATALVWVAARRMSGPWQGSPARFAAMVPVSILAHVSYDILAAYTIFGNRGYSFPILGPVNFSLVGFPMWSWVIFEGAALGLAFLVASSSDGSGRNLNSLPTTRDS